MVLLCFLVELDHINPAHTISAALCYATQLVNILSHILDVNLPKKLCNRLGCYVMECFLNRSEQDEL